MEVGTLYPQHCSQPENDSRIAGLLMGWFHYYPCLRWLPFNPQTWISTISEEPFVRMMTWYDMGTLHPWLVVIPMGWWRPWRLCWNLFLWSSRSSLLSLFPECKARIESVAVHLWTQHPQTLQQLIHCEWWDVLGCTVGWLRNIKPAAKRPTTNQQPSFIGGGIVFTSVDVQLESLQPHLTLRLATTTFALPESRSAGTMNGWNGGVKNLADSG